MSEPIADGWMTTDQAARLTGYARVTIWRLARTGRVRARKMGRDWLVEMDSLLAHKAQMDALGTRRYSPWRPDLAEQGRGRKQKEVQDD